jgi:TonB family protein
VRRFDQRQGFLVSAAVHLTLLMLLIAHPPAPRPRDEIDPSTLEKKDLVFMPPASVIRQLVPKAAIPKPIPPAAPSAPRPTPPPPDPAGKDRISVGPRTPVRNEGPLNLDSIGQVPKGTQLDRLNPPASPTPAPTAPAAPPAPTPLPRVADASASRPGAMGPPDPITAGRPGLRLPPGLMGRSPAGDEGNPTHGLSGSSVDRAVTEAARRANESGGAFGMPNGQALDISGLSFDDQGADFSIWLSHFRDELRRNFIAPQTLYLGFRGRVVVQFVVERNGDISSLQVLESSRTSSLDRSVTNALASSRLMPLPNDYRPPRVVFTLIANFR